MRIKSPFHDYYDSAMGLGQDQSILYLRKTEVAESGWGDLPAIRRHLDRDIFNEVIVGFCGKIYGAVSLRLVNATHTYETLAWDTAAADTFMKAHCREQAVKAWENPKEWGFMYGVGGGQQAVEAFFAECEQKRGAFAWLFEEYKAPVFLFEHVAKTRYNWKVRRIINPKLKELGFAKIKDPYTAFQEIAMWLGAQAWPNKPIPKVSDEDMAQAKGFDKWSFRKEPKKK